VFFRLRQLRPGDRIYKQHADGTLVVFRVYAEHTFAKDHFPTQKLYGPAPTRNCASSPVAGVRRGYRLVPEHRRRLRRCPARPACTSRKISEILVRADASGRWPSGVRGDLGAVR